MENTQANSISKSIEGSLEVWESSSNLSLFEGFRLAVCARCFCCICAFVLFERLLFAVQIMECHVWFLKTCPRTTNPFVIPVYAILVWGKYAHHWFSTKGLLMMDTEGTDEQKKLNTRWYAGYLAVPWVVCLSVWFHRGVSVWVSYWNCDSYFLSQSGCVFHDYLCVNVVVMKRCVKSSSVLHRRRLPCVGDTYVCVLATVW